MSNKRKKRSIYLKTLLWILIPLCILNGLGFVFSYGDMLGVFLAGMFSLVLLCWGLFFSYSFLLGYKAGKGKGIAVTVLLLIIGGFLWQSAGSWVEPGTLWRRLVYAILFFGVILSVGRLCRYGIKAGGFIRLGSILVFIIVAFVSVTICLSTLCGAYSPVPEGLFWKDAYPEKAENGTVFFHDTKMSINPFDSRVIGVFRFNDKKEYVGFSSSIYECHKIENQRYQVNDTIKASTCDFIHNSYEPLLSNFMSDCRDALYRKEADYCVFLYTKEGLLHRKEFDYHSNGIVKQARSYTYDREKGFHIEEEKTIEFDELGFCDKKGRVRWSIKDFHQTDTVIDIESRYGLAYNPIAKDGKYTESQQFIIDSFITVESKATHPDSLKKYSSLDFPLDEYYKLGSLNGHTISVDISIDEYKWRKIYLSDFTPLKTTEQMYSFVDALELSRLDTGMWVRIGEQSFVVGKDDECYSFMLKENVKDGNIMVLYLFGNYAVTVDSRFCFYFDPSVHKDPEIRKRAKESWNEMEKIFVEYKEKENQ